MNELKENLPDACRAAGLEPANLRDLSQASDDLKIYSIEVPGSQAIATWRALHAQAKRTGYWPVIAGSPAEFAGRNIEALIAKLHDVQSFLKESHDMSVDEWFLSAFAKVDFHEQEVPAEVGVIIHEAFKKYTDKITPESLKKFEETCREHEINATGWLSGEYTCLHCPAPVVTPTSDADLIGHKNILTNQPYDTVVLMLVPTALAWEVPAYLLVGLGEQLHAPHEHAAIHKFWYEKYGAEIITSTSDTIEMLVAHPPTTAEDALELAQQQFAYAPNIVNHGIGKTSALASQLKNGTTWYFWWDEAGEPAAC